MVVHSRKFQLLKFMLVLALGLGLICLIAACTYIQAVSKQTAFSRIQATDPSQRNLKHMIERQTFFVYGLILDSHKILTKQSFTVAAYSSRYTNNELVDAKQVTNTETHYGLTLPEGHYDLLVFADQDHNNRFDQAEVVGWRQIDLSIESYPEKVVGNIDIELAEQEAVAWRINLPVPKATPSGDSLFYPKGTLRNLNDPLFDAEIAALGMYEPAAFLAQAQTMFYALEEDSYKIPIVFVHGIGGSAREFLPLVNQLDRQRYKPWFFYYPSGMDLDQLAQFFYNIFLSGQVIPLGDMPLIIVAYSMGGLVVKEAMNKVQGSSRENRVALLITLASPWGGHPAAAAGEKHAPLVLPSWRDMNPASSFIKRLFRKPLPPQLNHQLLYAYGNPDSLKLGENSDGVAPLSSQLHPVAQRQSTAQFGFNSSHTSVLKDEAAIQYMIQSISQVKSIYPESHINILMTGGYNVALDNRYSDKEKHLIRSMGKYLSLLANGTLDSLEDPVLEHFVDVAQGSAKAETETEVAWLKFIRDYPSYAERRLP